MRIVKLDRNIVAASAEREHKSLHARVEELDLEVMVLDGARLPDQLIQALLRRRSLALGVRVAAVGGPRRMSVDQDAKTAATSPPRPPPARSGARPRPGGR